MQASASVKPSETGVARRLTAALLQVRWRCARFIAGPHLACGVKALGGAARRTGKRACYPPRGEHVDTILLGLAPPRAVDCAYAGLKKTPLWSRSGSSLRPDTRTWHEMPLPTATCACGTGSDQGPILLNALPFQPSQLFLLLPLPAGGTSSREDRRNGRVRRRHSGRKDRSPTTTVSAMGPLKKCVMPPASVS